MSKLLSANFARLWKNKLFWVLMACMAFMGIYKPISCWKDITANGYDATLNNVFFQYAIFILILAAVFCSLFIGREYSDGTIRNKVIAGHTRAAIYFSNLIVCAVADVLMCLAFIVPALLVGIPLLGFLTPATDVLIGVLCSLAMSVALSSIFNMTAMLIQNKAAVGIICILIAFAMLFGGLEIRTKLSMSEFNVTYTTLDNGEELREVLPNPRAVHGTKRVIYEFLYDFLPGGQAQQFEPERAKPEHAALLPIYSGIIIILTSGIGVLLFRKKDLK